jgi:serine phosphatase RsbU (regulator of sigma subunit)
MQAENNDAKPDRPLRVLLVEDSPFDAELLAARVGSGGFRLHMRRVDSRAGLEAALKDESWDVILSDHNMPGFSSTEALEMVKREKQLDVPFLIVSGSIGEEIAVESMRAGASDYILKENLTRLVPAIERELRDAVERRERRKAEKALVAQEEQMRIARNIQQRLFPATAPLLSGFDICGASHPADATGGDYFDYIPMPNGMLAAVIGDVSGHGLGAALLMTAAREALRAFAFGGSDPREIILHADQLLRADFGEERFITLLLVLLDPSGKALAYVSAGHPAGYILDASGKISRSLSAQGPALCLQCIEPNVPQLTPISLQPGDIAVLLTDGVIEAASPAGEEFGPDRALDAIRANREKSSAEIVSGLLGSVRDFIGAQPQQDDITTVIIKYTGNPA